MSYKEKYLKYKKKYLNLKAEIGGSYHGALDQEELERKPEEENKEREAEISRKSKIEIINGPSEFDYYEIRLSNGDNKKILMFGEDHTEYSKCSSTDTKCIDMINFLEIITNSNKNIAHYNKH